MNPTAIYSKSGKGVQEASGKTSLLQRADRAVLSAIDGRATLADVAQKVGKAFDPAFQKLINQLDKDGFIREVSGGTATAAPAAAAKPAAKPAAKAAGGDLGADLDFSSLGAPSKPVNPPSRPAAPPPPPPPKPAAQAPNFSQLDFSTLGTQPKPSGPAPKPAAPPAPGAAKEQQSALAKAREEAEARAQAERDRIKAEAEAKTRAEMETKMRAEAERKMKDEAAAKEAAAAKAAADAEAKAKAAREAALKAAEAKVKAEQEAKVRIEAERKAREDMERRLEQERKAREEAERKAKEEAERVRKEAEEKARLEREEMERRLEQERKAREEAERKAKEEAERVRREFEEERKRLEADRKRDDEARAKRDEEEREARRRKEEEQAAALLAAAQAREAKPAAPAAPKAEAKKEQSFGDSLLADLDNFTNRDDEERKAKEEEERKTKAEGERRRREEAERKEQEDAERQRREDEERRRQEEEARRAREEEERRAQEEERRKREADEIRRKAAAATAAAMAKEGRGAAKEEEDDIPISDDDLAMDEVKREQAALARTQAKDREEQKKREKAALKAERRAEADSVRIRKPVKWARLIGTTLVLLIVAGVIAVHVMPAPLAEYERSATEALGRPVKIGSGHYWLLTGPEIRFSDVRIGDAHITEVAASIAPASIFDDRKEFTRVEIDGLRLPQEALAEAIFTKVKAENLAVDRIVIKNLELPGPTVLPKSLQADVVLDGQGALRAAVLRGPDGLVAKIVPKEGAVEFDVVAAGFTLPIAPEITLSKFAMKGSATLRGMKVDEWGGAIFNGGISGTANIRWGGTWTVEGVVTVRGINAAVFAPALVSTGTGEGTGRFSMAGADPAKLGTTGRVDGSFTVTQGTLGSFDLAKGIQTGGKQALGTTTFTEMTGQAVYDRGAVALRNVNIGAGALNAAASADIAQGGALSGRIVADMKSSSRQQSAVIVLGGTVKEPQVRN